MIDFILKFPRAIQRWFLDNTFYRELVWVIIRWILLVGSVIVLALLGGWLFEPLREQTSPSAPLIIKGREDGTRVVGFTPDGGTLVTISADSSLRYWDLNAQDPTVDPVFAQGHETPYTDAALSENGRWVAVGGADGTVWLFDRWASDSGKEPIILRGHVAPITVTAFSPGDRWLVTASQDTGIRLWNLMITPTISIPESSILLTGHGGPITSIAFSEDRRWLASGSEDESARLWDLTYADTHPEQITSTAVVLLGHGDTVKTVAFSPNDRWLATGGADNTVRLWDIFSIHSSTGVESITFKSHRGDINVVTFSPYGHWLVTASEDKTIQLWDMTALDLAAQEPIVLKGHRKGVTAVSFTPNRNWLISTSNDKTIRLWDMDTEYVGQEKPFVLRGHDGPVLSVAISSDSIKFATDSADNTIRIYDLRTTAPPSHPFFNQNSLRYIIPPVIAFLIVILAGARYVQDIYLLKSFQLGLRFVITSMFGVLYPQLTIDKGRPILKKGETNLLTAIGGPGFVILQPGNAAFFNYLRRPTSARINRYVFLGPFESLGPVVNLDDQHGHIEETFGVTRDGIRVKLQDINFRYRVPYRKGARRTLEDPYPFDPDALDRRGANVTINNDGLVSWEFSVNMAVNTAIRSYISTHTIDHLTAPREAGRDPRRDFRHYVMKNTRVFGVGAEILWVDLGHIHILDEEVDEAREEFWAAEWKGQAEVQRALSRAQQQIFMEQGRARAQADMILSITQALQEAEITGSTADNIRNVFLSRIAQIIENMRAPDEGKGKK